MRWWIAALAVVLVGCSGSTEPAATTASTTTAIPRFGSADLPLLEGAACTVAHARDLLSRAVWTMTAEDESGRRTIEAEGWTGTPEGRAVVQSSHDRLEAEATFLLGATEYLAGVCSLAAPAVLHEIEEVRAAALRLQRILQEVCDAYRDKGLRC